MVDELNKPIPIDIEGNANTTVQHLVQQFNQLNTQLSTFLTGMQDVDKKLQQNLKKVEQYVKAIDASNRVNVSTLRASLNATPEALAAAQATTRRRAATTITRGQEDKIFNNYYERQSAITDRTFTSAAKRGQLDTLGKAVEARLARAKAAQINNTEEYAKNLERYQKELMLYNQFKQKQADELRQQREREKEQQRQQREREKEQHRQALQQQREQARLATPQGQYQLIRQQALQNQLGQPFGRTALSLNEYARYNRVNDTASNQKLVNNMMASSKLYNTTAPSQYGSNITIDSAKNRLQEAAIQRQALQNTLSRAYLKDDSTGVQKAEQTLKALKEETTFLSKAIAELEKYNAAQNQSLQTLRQKNELLKAQQKLAQMNPSGLRSNSQVSSLSILQNTADADSKKLAIQKELAKANKILNQAEKAENSQVIKDTQKIISLYQSELSAIKDRTEALKKQKIEQDKLATPKGQYQLIRDTQLGNKISTPQGKNVLTVNEYAKYMRMDEKAIATAQILARAKNSNVYSVKNPTSYNGNINLNTANERLNDASVQRDALKYLKNQSQLKGDSTGVQRAEQALKALKEETTFLSKAIAELERYNAAQNQTLQTLRQKNEVQKAEQKLAGMNPQGFRTTSQVNDIRQLKSAADADAKRIVIQKELVTANKALTQAEKAGNTQVISDIKKVIDIYQQELRAIKEINSEIAKSDQIKGRLQQLTSSEGLGGLFGIQALIAKNYALLNGFQNMITGTYQFLREFEQALKQTQAISQATTTQMEGLKESILDVSNTTRFGAVELAEATTTLAQAGFSLSDIQTSLSSVAILATATGSSLAETVDIATSVLGAFQMSASSMPTVVNQITQAMNLSKLDIQKFQLAIQYAGNAAADAGLNFQEMLSSVAAVSNTGVRSGSTLGTGFRQLLADMISPSEKFQAVLKKLGLTTADVDVRTEGLVGAIKNLREAGFSTMDAYDSFEVRAVAFYTALSNNLDSYDALSDSMDNNTAAMEANEIQMDSLAAQSDRAKNQFKVLGETIGGETRQAFTDFFRIVADVVTILSQGLQNGITGTIVKWATLTLAMSAVIAGATLTYKTLSGLITIIGVLTAANTAAAASTTRLAAALALLQKGNMWILALGAALAGAAIMWQKFRQNSQTTIRELERAKTVLNDTKDRISTLGTSIDETDNKIRSINARFKTLSENPEEVSREFATLQAKAVELGVTLDTNLTNSVDDLKKGWQELRSELAKKLEVDLSGVEAALQAVQSLRIQKYREKVIDPINKRNATFLGLSRQSITGVKNDFTGKGIVPFKDLNNPGRDPLFTDYGNSGLVSLLAQVQGKDRTSPEVQKVLQTLNDFNKLTLDESSFTTNNTQALEKAVEQMQILTEARREIEEGIITASNRKGLSSSDRIDILKNRQYVSDIFDTPDSGILARYNLLQSSGSNKRQQQQARITYAANQEDIKISDQIEAGTLGNSNFLSKSALARANSYRGPQAKLNPKFVEQWKDYSTFFSASAARQGIPVNLLKAVGLAESGGNANARSPVGALGLMQFMPATAGRFNLKDRTNPEQSIEAAAKYLALLLKRYNNDAEKAIAAYNAGEGNVDKYKGIPPFAETQQYVGKVLRKFVDLENGGSATSTTVFDGKESNQLETMRKQVSALQAQASEVSLELKTLEAANKDDVRVQDAQGRLNAINSNIAKLQESMADNISNAQKETESKKDFELTRIEIELREKEKEIQRLRVQLQDVDIADYKTKGEPLYNQIATSLTERSAINTRLEKLKGGKFGNSSADFQLDITTAQKIELEQRIQLDSDLTTLRRQRIAEEKSYNENLKKIYVDRQKQDVKEYKDATDKLEQDRNLEDSREQLRRRILNSSLSKNLTQMKNQRAMMDDPNYRNNYSNIQREDMDREIAKRESAFNREVARGDAEIDLATLNSRMDRSRKQLLTAQAAAALSAEDMEQVLVDAKGNELDDRYQAAQDKFNYFKGQVNELEKNISESEARVIDLQNTIDANNPDNAPEAMSIYKSLATKARQDVIDMGKVENQTATAQSMIDGVTDSFQGFIQTAIDASDSMDDFFKMITGGSHESAEAFRALGRDILQSIYKVVMDKMTKQFIDMLFNGGKANSQTGSGVLGQVLSWGASFFAPGAGAAAGATAGAGSTMLANAGFTPMANGGRVTGGIPGRDSVNALLMPDEQVVPTKVTDVVGHKFFDELRADPKGTLGSLSKPMFVPASNGPAATTNVYVVSPDQKPTTLSETDVVAHISNNVQKNGTIKQLIKQVVNGG